MLDKLSGYRTYLLIAAGIVWGIVTTKKLVAVDQDTATSVLLAIFGAAGITMRAAQARTHEAVTGEDPPPPPSTGARSS